MRHQILSCAAAFLAVAIPTFAQAPSPPLDPDIQPSLAGASEHVYKRVGAADLKLWVFSPADLRPSDTRPAIVLFSGGGWTTQNPLQLTPHARWLTAKGLIAVVAGYRVRMTGGSAYNSVADAKSAIRWLRQHAAEFHIAPNAVAAGGASAGGHLALCTAVLSDFDEPAEDKTISSKPNALVVFSAVPDTVPDPQRTLLPIEKSIFDWLGARSTEISPILHLEKNLPPTIMFHGTGDSSVPIADVQMFCGRANELGNRCELVRFEGAGHAFFNPVLGRTWYDRAMPLAEKFLAGLGYIR